MRLAEASVGVGAGELDVQVFQGHLRGREERQHLVVHVLVVLAGLLPREGWTGRGLGQQQHCVSRHVRRPLLVVRQRRGEGLARGEGVAAARLETPPRPVIRHLFQVRARGQGGRVRQLAEDLHLSLGEGGEGVFVLLQILRLQQLHLAEARQGRIHRLCEEPLQGSQVKEAVHALVGQAVDGCLWVPLPLSLLLFLRDPLTARLGQNHAIGGDLLELAPTDPADDGHHRSPREERQLGDALHVREGEVLRVEDDECVVHHRLRDREENGGGEQHAQVQALLVRDEQQLVEVDRGHAPRGDVGKEVLQEDGLRRGGVRQRQLLRETVQHGRLEAQ